MPITEHDMSTTEDEMTLEKALKEHRLAANYSVDELALKLNLKASVIENIENNLTQMIEDKQYPIIYLRGYLANYSKAVQLPNIESFPEYQQLNNPEKSVATLSNPYILTNNNKKSSNKFAWFVLVLFISFISATIYYWSDISASLFTQAVVDTENIHMRLPEAGENNFISSPTEGEKLVESQTIDNSSVESPVLDSQEATEDSTESSTTL